LALIILSSIVIADEVKLTEPIGDFYDTNDVSFKCNVTADSAISSFELFFGDDIEFKMNKTISVTGNSTAQIFNVVGIENGNYIWNCRANLANGSRFMAANNETFGVSVASDNTAPEQIKNLTEIEVNKNENITLNMSEYFTDADGDSLTYSVSDETNIEIEITNEMIQFIPMAGWSGEKIIDITADDGSETSSIENIVLKVIDTDAIDWDGLGNNFKITNISPIETPYSMTDSNPETFTVTTNDVNATFQWALGGEDLPGAISSSYIMNSAVVGTGTLSVLVTYSDQTTETQSWTLNIVAEEQVVQKQIEEVPEPVCGNKVREEGEDCSSCPADVACGPGFECQEKTCVKSSKQFVGILIGLVVGTIILIIGAIYIFRFIKSSVEPDEENKIKPLTEVEKPIPDKPTSISEIKTQEKPVLINVEQHKLVDSKPDPLLMEFINKMRAKGKTDEEIKIKLKASGWSEAQIAPGFK